MGLSDRIKASMAEGSLDKAHAWVGDNPQSAAQKVDDFREAKINPLAQSRNPEIGVRGFEPPTT
ncbi:MAG: hypothetical protein HXY36_02605 [Chloroflexi bacterium]|nr:hypothetical protein [Chloroflexota bacterium]